MSKNSDAPHVVIIGAGFAGLNAAQTLAMKKVRVTLVDRNNYHLFQPLLYQVASTGLNPSEISAIVRSNFRKLKNVRVLMAEMTGLNKDQKRIEFNRGEFALDYDYLILGLGGKTSYFGNDQWADMAPGLKSLDDAVTIRNRLLNSFEQAEREADPTTFDALTSVVVIGGGPTGVELAGAFAELRGQVITHDFRSFEPKDIKVTLLEGGPTLLNGYDPKSSQYTKERLEKLGVEVLLNERVTDVTPEGVRTQNRFLFSHNIVWAAGVEGNPLSGMVTDKIDNRGRVLITATLEVEGESDIYACGDMTYYGHDERYPRGLPGVAPVALQQGKRAALNILARIQGGESKPFRYFDKGRMATIGRSAAVAETTSLKMRGFLAWVAWLFVHLLYLVEFQDRLVVFMRWVWSYITWHWGVRLIFAAGKDRQIEESREATREPDPAENPLERSEPEATSSEAGRVENSQEPSGPEVTPPEAG